MTPRTQQEAKTLVVGEPIPSTREPVMAAPKPTSRGTSNGNDRGSAADRRRRRAWLMECYASNVPGYTRCYRCGFLLFNPDAPPEDDSFGLPLTVDRIIPGCRGGTYRRTNIRPACGPCNSETGGALARRGGKK